MADACVWAPHRAGWLQPKIDEFSIHVIPILIAQGISLVQPRHRSIRLKLLSTKTFPDGVVHLNSRVKDSL